MILNGESSVLQQSFYIWIAFAPRKALTENYICFALSLFLQTITKLIICLWCMHNQRVRLQITHDLVISATSKLDRLLSDVRPTSRGKIFVHNCTRSLPAERWRLVRPWSGCSTWKLGWYWYRDRGFQKLVASTRSAFLLSLELRHTFCTQTVHVIRSEGDVISECAVIGCLHTVQLLRM